MLFRFRGFLGEKTRLLQQSSRPPSPLLTRRTDLGAAEIFLFCFPRVVWTTITSGRAYFSEGPANGKGNPVFTIAYSFSASGTVLTRAADGIDAVSKVQLAARLRCIF